MKPPWRSIASIMNAKVLLRNSTTASGGRSRAFFVKLRMSRNITQISRMSPVNSDGLSNRRSTTDGDTCWPRFGVSVGALWIEHQGTNQAQERDLFGTSRAAEERTDFDIRYLAA